MCTTARQTDILSSAYLQSTAHCPRGRKSERSKFFFFFKKDREIRSKTIKKYILKKQGAKGENRVERKLWKKFLVQFYKSRKTKLKSKFLDAEM